MGKSGWLYSELELHGGCRKFAYLQKDPSQKPGVGEAKSSHLQEKAVAR